MKNPQLALKEIAPSPDLPEGEESRVFANATRLLTTRRSVRRYLPKPIAKRTILNLLEVAVTAPSAHNRQPWRFSILTAYEAKAKLARSTGQRLRRERLADGDPPEAINIDVQRSFDRITAAPVVIVVCTTVIDMDRYPDQRRNDAERLMAIQGTTSAVQNLLIAAHAAGLGACWMCAPLFCPEVVSETLDLPRDWEPLALITMGYPANAGKPFARRAISEIARFD